MSNDRVLDKPDWVSPPGHTIVTILEERELTVEEFARQIGRSTAVAQRLLDGSHSIDMELARRLAMTLGASQNFWIAREHDYRGNVVAPGNVSVDSLSDLLAKLPVSDMRKFGWIEEAKSKDERIAECLSFFGVSTLAQWHGRYENAFRQAAYRRSASYASCEVATAAWLRQGEIETQHNKVAGWSPKALESQIPHFRRLTWYKSPALFLPKLKDAFAEAGVKFAVVRAPKGCVASGAVRVLADETPHLQLSFRYLSDDQFWFSLFHEVGHLLLHFHKMPIVEDAELQEDDCEREANSFASQVIIPMEHREEMRSLGSSRAKIIDFSKKVGIAPGLVVGQMQYDGTLRYSQMQHLKRRFSWTD